LTYEEASGENKDKLRAENEIVMAYDLEKEDLRNISKKVIILPLSYYVERYHPIAVK
jgi:hypothetical protein